MEEMRILVEVCIGRGIIMEKGLVVDGVLMVGVEGEKIQELVRKENVADLRLKIKNLKNQFSLSNKMIDKESKMKVNAMVMSIMIEKGLSKNQAYKKVYDEEWVSNNTDSCKGCRIDVGWDPLVVSATLLSQSDQAMHLSVRSLLDNKLLFVSVIYGEITPKSRFRLWRNLRDHMSIVGSEPWVFLGDFNVILKSNENLNGLNVKSEGTQDFRECIDCLGVTDINMNRVQECLDRDPSNVALRKEEMVYATAFKDTALDEEKDAIEAEDADSLFSKRLDVDVANCAFKVDILKAYDTVSWSFLEFCLRKFGFHPIMVNWIMIYLTIASFSLCINGESHGIFDTSGYVYERVTKPRRLEMSLLILILSLRPEEADDEPEAEEADDELEVKEASVEPEAEGADVERDLEALRRQERIREAESETSRTEIAFLGSKAKIGKMERFYLEMVLKGVVPKLPSDDEGSVRPRKMPKRIMPPKPMSKARMREIIRDQFATSMNEFMANMNSGAGGSGGDSGSGGAGGSGGTGENADGTGVRGTGPTVLELTGCTYATFIKCDPLPFNGTEGAICL
nr:hypothetical protein [Tanacetum cinerariifolium]